MKFVLIYYNLVISLIDVKSSNRTNILD